MEEQENPLDRDCSLSVVLPGGLEKNATVHGSQPVMDLLVTLCASYHLNPSDYTVELLSPNKNHVSFKPNSPIGALEAEKILLKPKGGAGVEERVRRPYMPEASVRLLINYNKSHKAVLRVNPRLPLEALLPLVCDKCELPAASTELLRDARSATPLDLSRTLNELGLREVFARDTAPGDPRPQAEGTPRSAVTPPEAGSPPPTQEQQKKKPKEPSGFLSLFRRRKKDGAGGAPASPGPSSQPEVRAKPAAAADGPKKRRAPPPPLGASQSVPSSLSSCRTAGQKSADSPLRSTKRRAPPPPPPAPPPCAEHQQELQECAEVKGTVDSLSAVEELREGDGRLSSSSSPYPSHSRSSSSLSRPAFPQLHDVADSLRGKDFSDARCALAKVLTSSVSRTTLVKRLRNSTTFPKFPNGSSFLSPRSSDNREFCAELESVRTSDLPTENEWADPLQRKGMTTFKVVPQRKPASPEPDPNPEQPGIEERGAEGPPEPEEDPGSPLQSPEPAPSSPAAAPQESPAGSPLPEAEESLENQEETEEEEEEEEEEEVEEPGAPCEETAAEGEPTCEVQVQEEEEGEVEKEKEEVEQEKEEEEEEMGQEKEEVEREKEEEEEEEEVVQEREEGEVKQEKEEEKEVKQEKEEMEQEKEGEEEEEEEEECFPPPPPPVFFHENFFLEENEQTSAFSPPHNEQTDASTEDQNGTEPTSLPDPDPDPGPGPGPGPGLDPCAAPSRFAAAVALAVQRSRLQSRGKALGPAAPHGTLPSPTRAAFQYGA